LDISVFLGVGVVLTVLLEALATGMFERWAYSDAMPRLPGIGIGYAVAAMAGHPALGAVVRSPADCIWITPGRLQGNLDSAAALRAALPSFYVTQNVLPSWPSNPKDTLVRIPGTTRLDRCRSLL
jgi:hypothetical protein